MAFSTEAALGYLRRANEQDRLAHAYLISGATGSGKRRLAANLTNLVSGIDPEKVFSPNTPGVFLAEPESKSRRIVIEQIRELEHTLQMRASNGRRKVVIISDADRLQPQAANAFLKTQEEPPKDSLLLLLSALPEALPDTILSRCIAIPLAANAAREPSREERQLIDVLRKSSTQKNWDVQFAYRLAQEFQILLRGIREQIKAENDEALEREEARYRNSTEGTWLDDREEYYKALNESRYLERRARLVETLLLWWADGLRASSGVEAREIPQAKRETQSLAERFTSVEILRRIRHLEDLRDYLGRNIQEALAVEVAFLNVFAGT
jgi:DNA polymerase-3 subunit delta'